MEEYIYSVVLSDNRGHITNAFGVALAHSTAEASAIGLALTRLRNPGYPHIVGFSAMLLAEAQADPARSESR